MTFYIRHPSPSHLLSLLALPPQPPHSPLSAPACNLLCLLTPSLPSCARLRHTQITFFSSTRAWSDGNLSSPLSSSTNPPAPLGLRF